VPDHSAAALRPHLAAIERAVAEMPAEEVPALVGELERLKLALLARQSTPSVAAVEEPERLLSIEEAAGILAVPKSRVAEMARRREIPALKVGRYPRIRVSTLREWIERNEEIGLDR